MQPSILDTIHTSCPKCNRWMPTEGIFPRHCDPLLMNRRTNKGPDCEGSGHAGRDLDDIRPLWSDGREWKLVKIGHHSGWKYEVSDQGRVRHLSGNPMGQSWFFPYKTNISVKMKLSELMQVWEGAVCYRGCLGPDAWRPVFGFEGYQINVSGSVIDRGCESRVIDVEGRVHIDPVGESKWMEPDDQDCVTLHRSIPVVLMVASAFLGPCPPGGMLYSHDESFNFPENLYYAPVR
jgi:hypothetical protein